MRSPFPGMDPYVESPAQWPDFHSTFIHALRETIADVLPEPFFARVQEDVVLLEPDPPAYKAIPDVLVGATGRGTYSNPGAATLEPTTLENVVVLDRRTEYFIEIVRMPAAEVVTVVEVLSPANKGGGGRAFYADKRARILQSEANLVELDLLRAGRRMTLSKPYPPGHYYALVSRSPTQPKCDVYSWSVRDRLPRIPLPLREPTADATADLAAAFDVAWQRGRYDRFINYSEPPPSPAFSPEDAEWIVTTAKTAVGR